MASIKFLIRSACLLLWVSISVDTPAQKLPACIEQQHSKLRKYTGIVKISDGREVYRISLSRPNRCMDCSSGVVYVDSLCNQVAGFIIGIAPQVSVAEGYRYTDFPEASTPVFQKAIERKQQGDSSINFRKVMNFRILQTYGEADTLFSRGQLLTISNAAGMRHWQSEQKKTDYKIIPQRASAVCSNIHSGADLVVYYIDIWNRFFKVVPRGRQFYFYISENRFISEQPAEKAVCLWRPILLLENIND